MPLHPFGRTISACSSVSKSSLQRRPSYLCLPWRIGPPVASGSYLVSAKEKSPISRGSRSGIQLTKKFSKKIMSFNIDSSCSARRYSKGSRKCRRKNLKTTTSLRTSKRTEGDKREKKITTMKSPAAFGKRVISAIAPIPSLFYI